LVSFGRGRERSVDLWWYRAAPVTGCHAVRPGFARGRTRGPAMRAVWSQAPKAGAAGR